MEWQTKLWDRLCGWLFNRDTLRRLLIWRNLDGIGHDWRYDVYIYLATQAYYCEVARQEVEDARP